MQNPEESIGFLINDVARLMRRNFNRRAQNLGLSQAQWQALAYLRRQEGGKQVTLADTLEIQPITLARLIDRLEEAGLVSRQPDPNDRRAIRLYLTDKAEPLLREMQEMSAETKRQATMALTDDARNQFIATLQQVKQSLLCAESQIEGEADSLPDSASNTKKRAY